MARIFITGSADGLGQLSARLLVTQGHQVVLHGRNEARAHAALEGVPGAEKALAADLSDMHATIALAHQVNAMGSFDAIIHNAGVYRDTARQIFAINTLAPYILTSLINRPKRIIYLSSGMHLHGRPNLDYFTRDVNRLSYSDSKLHVVLLAQTVARYWPGVFANAVDPGWVPTKMGGAGAPDDLVQGYKTQVWLATSNDEKVKVTGRYFFHQKQRPCNPTANDTATQEKFIRLCSDITGVTFPHAET